MNKIEEMKKQYIKGVVLIGVIAIMISFFGLVQAIQYENQLTQINTHLESSIETNKMLNNQLLTTSLENKMIKLDLNNCVLQYNQLYGEANQMYQYINSLGDTNE